MERLEGNKILVTGFTGRLGGAFAEGLAKNNEVTGVTLAAGEQELDRWRALSVTPYVMDLAASDYGDLPTDYDYVVHTAADVCPKTYEDGLRANCEAPALLMRHVAGAKAFLHVSTISVYGEPEDPYCRARETDPVGIGANALMGHYAGTKLVGEGAVRAMSRLLEMPSIICRMDTQYGTYNDGGLPVKMIANIINGKPINLPKSKPWVKSLIHQDDLFAFIEPCLSAAAVPAPVVNWAGDEQMKAEDWMGDGGELVGREPVYNYDDALGMPSGAPSPELRTSITGPAKVSVREGLRRVTEHWEPLIRRGAYQPRGF